MKAPETREEAINRIANEVPDYPEDRFLVANRIVDCLNLSWPCERCNRLSGDNICWYHNA